MPFLFELLIPIFLVIIFTVLYERWKEGNSQPIKVHFLQILARIAICLLSISVALFVFGYLLGAREEQLMIIIAITFGVTYAVVSYFFESISGNH